MKSLTPTVTNTPTPTVTVTSTLMETPTITPTVTATAQVPQGETWLYYYYAGTTRIATPSATLQGRCIVRQMSQYGDNVMFLLTDLTPSGFPFPYREGEEGDLMVVAIFHGRRWNERSIPLSLREGGVPVTGYKNAANTDPGEGTYPLNSEEVNGEG